MKALLVVSLLCCFGLSAEEGKDDLPELNSTVRVVGHPSGKKDKGKHFEVNFCERCK